MSKPSKFAQIVYRTRHFEEMTEWYRKVFEADVRRSRSKPNSRGKNIRKGERMQGIRFTAAFALAVACSTVAAQANKAQIERGRYLAEGVVACANCHIQRDKGKPLFDRGMSGGMVFDEAPFKAYGPNITPDAETGIGKWTAAQLAKSIREGVRPDGSIIGPPMPIELYRVIADDDLNAMVAYIRSLPAVRNEVPKSEYRIKLPPNYGPPVAKVVAPPKSDQVKYGGYLVRIGHCMECHTVASGAQMVMAKFGAGGRVFKGPWGEAVARNLTPHETGIKDMTDAQIERAIREGIDRNGNPLKPPMAYGWYNNINDEDMRAIIAYMRSLKPLPIGG